MGDGVVMSVVLYVSDNFFFKDKIKVKYKFNLCIFIFF